MGHNRSGDKRRLKLRRRIKEEKRLAARETPATPSKAKPAK